MSLPSSSILAELLDVGFDHQGVGVCLCDAGDRVVRWNRTFLQLFPELADLLHPGQPYRQCLQRVFEIDRPNAAPEEIERAVDHASQRRRHRAEPYVLRRQDGSRIRIERCHASDGHLLSLYRRLETHELSGELSEALDVISTISIGYALFDARGGYLSANGRYQEMFGTAPELLKPGSDYMAHLRHHAVHTLATSETARLEQLVQRDFATLIDSPEPQVFRSRDGHWLALEERRTASGALICLWSDVTEQVRVRRQVVTLQERLQDAIEHLADGFALYDSEDRLVVCNSRYRDTIQLDPELLVPGARWSDLMRAIVRQGRFPEALGNEKDWLAERRRRRAGGDATTELLCDDGTWLLVTDRRTREGGTVSIGTDITDLKRREAELSRQAAMLSAINYAATRLISHADWQSVADDLLSRLGLASGVSRVLVFKIDQSPDGTMLQSCYCEWTAAGIAPVKDLAHNRNAALVTDDPLRRDWQQRHHAGQVIQSRVRDLDGYLRHKLDQEGVLSVLSVPIRVNARLWGNITFQDCRHERVWSGVEIDVLATAALLLAEIIERDQIDTDLRESEQRFRSIAEALPIIITRFGEGTVLYASPPAAEMLGLPVAKLIGRGIADFYAATTQRDKLLRKLVRRNGLDDEEVSYRRDDGSLLEATLTARRITYDGQEAIISALTDLTARKAAEAEVARQREALHQADKMSAMGSLLAGVAHELNNPLAVLVGQALMMEEALSGLPDQRDRAGRIRAAAERCGRIVKTFLAMARQRPARHGEVDLAQVIDAVLDLTAYGIRSSDIRVVRDIAPELPPLWADQDQLSQLVLNLVINAQQALQNSGGQRRLRIGVRPLGSEGMSLEVADSGPGIPEELRTRVFEPFFTTKPAGVGTGIGLALCQSIVLNHGGRIELDRAPEGGALFRVWLPRGRPSGSGESEAPGERIAAPPVGVGYRILVVDDETEIGDMLCDILTEAGYRTRLASSGREALERLGEQRYDLILSDLRMPDLDGVGLYRTLRERWPELVERLIFVTGDILGGTETTELRQQVPILEKPFKPEEIKRLVAQRLMANGDSRSGDR